MTTDDPKRYFLGQDNSSHWYIVEESRRGEWHRWASLPEDDENGWEPPDFARRLSGGPYMVTFTDPKDYGE